MWSPAKLPTRLLGSKLEIINQKVRRQENNESKDIYEIIELIHANVKLPSEFLSPIKVVKISLDSEKEPTYRANIYIDKKGVRVWKSFVIEKVDGDFNFTPKLKESN